MTDTNMVITPVGRIPESTAEMKQDGPTVALPAGGGDTDPNPPGAGIPGEGEESEAEA